MSKKKNNNKIYFGVFIIFLMVSSSIGFMYSGDSNTKKVNGYKFTQTQGGWETYLDSIESWWAFSYLPNEIDFNVENFNFGSGEINIYSEEDNDYIEEFKFVLLYGQIVANEVDEVDCDLERITWILSSKSSNSEIIQENNCIYLNGNLNKFIDGLTYKIFGVI